MFTLQFWRASRVTSTTLAMLLAGLPLGMVVHSAPPATAPSHYRGEMRLWLRSMAMKNLEPVLLSGP